MSTVDRLTSWMRWDEPDGSLPPDLTLNSANVLAMCEATWGEWACTRRAGHTGRHAAGTGEHIVAVWPRGWRRESGAAS